MWDILSFGFKRTWALKQGFLTALFIGLLDLALMWMAFEQTIAESQRVLFLGGMSWLMIVLVGLWLIGESAQRVFSRRFSQKLLFEGISTNEIFFAKFLLLWLNLTLFECVLMPLLWFPFLEWNVSVLLPFLVSIGLGTLGFAAIMTTIGLLLEEEGASNALFFLVTFPLLTPILVLGLKCFDVDGGMGLGKLAMLLLGLDFIYLAAAFLLFEPVIDVKA